MYWDDRLKEILGKYKLASDNNMIEDRLIREYPQYNTEGSIIRLWNSLPDNTRLAIYGSGAHTKKLFEIVEYKKKEIVCLIDNMSPIDQLYGYPIIAEKELDVSKIDMVFISVMGGKETIKKSLKEKYPDIKIVDMYESLHLQDNENTERPFYFDLQMEVYFKVAVVREWLEAAEEDEELYRYLIYQYLTTFNFPAAFKMMSCAEEKYVHLKREYDEVKKEINALLKEMAERIAHKPKRTVSLLILDALKYQDLKTDDMPFLKSYCKKGLEMQRAYTHVPYTQMSFASMLTGNRLFENKLYNVEKIDQGDYFSFLEKRQAKFKYYGFCARRFRNENVESVGRGMLSEVFWKRLCKLTEEGAEETALLHCLETHTPYIGGEHKQFPIKDIDRFIQTGGEKARNQVEEQKRESLKFVDELCAFYIPLLHSEWIITSDHGDHTFDSCDDRNRLFWRESCIHVPYYVISIDQGETGVKENLLFSHLDTWKVLLNLIDEKAPFAGIEKRVFVESQRDFEYDEKHLFALKEKGMLKSGAAFKCWIFEKDKYVRYYNGDEEYYRLPDDDHNLADREEYSERIREIKDMIYKDFPDWNDARFFNSRTYYNIKEEL